MKINLRPSAPRILMPLALASVAIAMACGGGDDATEVPSAGGDPTQVPAATATTQPVTSTPTEAATSTTPPGASRFGGTLKIASVGSVQSFDPLWTTASSTANVSHTILEPLMAQKRDFSHGMALADSWDISADGLTWTWKIRDDVRFHDGTPLTTKEVVGTLRKQHNQANFWKVLVAEFGFEDFDQMVNAVDDLTFEIHLREPTGLVIDALSTQGFQQLIVTEAWYSLPSTESAPGEPIGTGPYKFESWTPGDRWVAVRNDDYTPSPEPADDLTGEKVAYFDRVEWIEISDQTTRVAALETGEVDWAQEFAQDLLGRVTRDPKLQTIPQAPFRLLGHFNHIKPPWNDPEWGVQLRRAVVMAYDNRAALQLATGDEALWRLCPSLLQCGTLWESDRGADGLYAANNIAAARDIVMSSPYAGMTLRVMDPQDRQPAHGAAQVTREVLEDIGFKVDFQPMDWATMVTRRADPELWEFFHTWSGIGVRAAPAGHLRFGELTYDAWFNNYQDTAGTQRDLFNKISRATSQEELIELNHQFNEYFYEDAIFLQVGEFFSNWASNVKVEGDLDSTGAGQKPFNKWFAQ